MPLEKQPERQPDPGHGPQRPEREDRHPHVEPDKFFGLDVESMSPRAQLTTALAVIVPVALAGVLLFALTNVGWIWFTFCWVIFPAFGLLVRGIAGLSDGGSRFPSVASGGERELLGALREHGELTPAEAAMETSLSVAEADRILKELAEGGHLQVRVRGGGLSYSLWGRDEMGQLEDR
jgi:hypothetical protein